MTRARTRVWLWGPVWFQMGLIFIISSIPYVSRLPGNMSDKTGHFIGYGILGVLMLRALARGRLAGVTFRAAAVAILLSAAYGVSDECHQYFVPGRSSDVHDVAADAAGAAAAALGVWAILKIASPLRDHDV